MFSENNQISGRQAFRLLTFDLLGFGTLMIPTALAQVSGQDGIFCIFIGICASLLYLKLLKQVFFGSTESYPFFLEKAFGKVVGTICLCGYLIYFLLLGGYSAYLFANLALTNLLKEESFLLVLFLVFLLVYLGMKGGIEGRARIYELLFWILMLPLFVMLIFAAGDVDTDYWTPVFYVDGTNAAAGGYYVFLCFSLVFLSLYLMEYLKDRKKLYQCSRRAILFSGIIIAVLYLILLGIFGANALAAMDFAAVTMMSRVQITGGFLKRVDAFMFGIWFFTLYALLSSAVFYGSSTMEHIFHKKKKLFPAVSLAAAFVLAALFYWNPGFEQMYRIFLWYIGTPFVVVIPVLLYLKQIFFSKKVRRNKKAITSICMVMLGAFMLSGCESAELEDKSFPVLLTVNNTENFTYAWLDQQVGNHTMIDYNHLKVVLIARDFFENEASLAEMLTMMQQEKDVPLNTYVLITEDTQAIEKLEENMSEPLGDYLEKLLENAKDRKKDVYTTLGMLYQEQENHLETFFIPVIKAEEDEIVISDYEVYQRGHALGKADANTAMLSFFTQNQLKSYTLCLQVNHFVKLSHPRITQEMSEVIQKNGITGKKVTIFVQCEGERLYPMESMPAEERTQDLDSQITEYLNEVAASALDHKIDVTNSYKKIGGYQRTWYDHYLNAPNFYEEDIEIEYQVKVNWTKL